MLARANRVVRADDFRTAVRRGRRWVTPLAVYYHFPRATAEPFRFGVIVSRSVGGSVVRNKLRRRYRALGRSLVDDGARGSDLVVRALPGSAQKSWAAVAEDFYGVAASSHIRSAEPRASEPRASEVSSPEPSSPEAAS